MTVEEDMLIRMKKNPKIELFDFQWPEPVELKIFIKDILEKEVDSKYYLSEKLQERFRKYLEDKNVKIMLQHHHDEVRQYEEYSPTLGKDMGDNFPIITAMRSYPRTGKKDEDGERTQNIEPRQDGCANTLTNIQKDNLVAEINVLGSLDSEGWEKRHEQIRRIYDTNGIMATLPTGQGGGVIPKIMQLCGDRDNPGLSIKEDIANTINANSMSDRQQVVLTGLQEHQSIKTDGVSNCLPSAMGEGGGHVPMIMDYRADEGFRERDEVSPTLTSHGNSSGGIPVPMVAISNCEPRECGWNKECSPTLKARDYKDPKIVSQIIDAVERQGDLQQPKVLDLYNRKANNHIAQTLSDPCHNSMRLLNQGKLRRLTPTECFRLQGFLNDEINLDGLSDTQKYKLAGNGQDCNIVTKIFEKMFL